MKKLGIIFIGLFLMTFAFTSVNAQSSASADASANILVALTIEKDADLNFGDISSTATAGSVSIDNAGTRAGTAGAAPVGTGGTAAQFTIEGPPSETIAVTVNPTTFDVENGGNSMEVTLDANDVSTATGTTSTGTAPVVLTFGGSVNVAANQAVGLYTNTAAFEVTVDYN
jgi:hypothetical protein